MQIFETGHETGPEPESSAVEAVALPAPLTTGFGKAIGPKTRAKLESRALMSTSVEGYLSEHSFQIPPEAEEKWCQRRGFTAPSIERREFLLRARTLFDGLLENRGVREISGELGVDSKTGGAIARIIYPEFEKVRKERAEAVFELLRGPGLNANQLVALELCAVQGLSRREAGEIMGCQFANVNFLIKSAREHVPELDTVIPDQNVARMLHYRRVAQRRGSDPEPKDLRPVDEILSSAPKYAPRGVIRHKCESSSEPALLAATICRAVQIVVPALQASGVREEALPAAGVAVCQYAAFFRNPERAIPALRRLITNADRTMLALDVPESTRRKLLQRLVQPRYVYDKSDPGERSSREQWNEAIGIRRKAMEDRVQGFLERRDTLQTLLKSRDLPPIVQSTIVSALDTSTKEGRELLRAAVLRKNRYLAVAEEMEAEGHPDIMVHRIGSDVSGNPSAVKEWRGNLETKLERHISSIAASRRVENFGFTSKTNFLNALRNARNGDANKLLGFIMRFEAGFGFADSSNPNSTIALLARQTLQLPTGYWGERPAEKFVRYASYMLRTANYMTLKGLYPQERGE